MGTRPGGRSVMAVAALAALTLLLALLPAAPAAAQSAPSAPAGRTALEDLVAAVVRIKTFINPDARTTEILGREREGSGVVIDEAGLVLTIGYLMVEAYAAEVTTQGGRTVPANVVGYDHETGLGLLRTIEPLKLKPLPLGRSAPVRAGDPVLIIGSGGAAMVAAATVAARREFAGSWEYLLDDAIFTTPPYSPWSGAALISREGRLVGVGSLVVSDTRGDGGRAPGNMFVPIDLLPPILADLIADGRVAGPGRPWLGVNAEEVRGRLVVARVTPVSPAEKAGVVRGDVLVAVDGAAPSGLADFYRKVWALGRAGATVPLDIQHGGETRRIEVRSMNRLDHLKLKSTF